MITTSGQRTSCNSRCHGIAKWRTVPLMLLTAVFAGFFGCTERRHEVTVEKLHEPGTEVIPSPAVPRPVIDPGGHVGAVYQIFLVNDDQAVLTCGIDNTVRFWDIDKGCCSQTLRISAEAVDGIIGADVSNDGQYLALSGFSPRVVVLSLRTKQVESVVDCRTSTNEIEIPRVVFSPDSQSLLSGSSEGEIAEWNWRTGERLRSRTEENAGVRGLAFADDGQVFAALFEDNTCRIYDRMMNTRATVAKNYFRPLCVDFICESHRFVIGWNDSYIGVFDADGHEEHSFERLHHSIHDVMVSDDGKKVLYTTNGTSERTGPMCGIMDLESGKDDVRFDGHNNTVFAGRFFKDDERIATLGGNSRETMIWNAKDGNPIQTLKGDGEIVHDVGWGDDGNAVGWTSSPNSTDIEKAFNLQTLSLIPAESVTKWHKEVVRRKRTPLRRGVALRDGMAGMEFHWSGRGRTFHILKFENPKLNGGYKARGRSLVRGDVPVVGTNSGLYAFDPETGNQTRRFETAPATFYSVAPHPTLDWFVTGSGDMRLQIWQVDRSLPLLSLFFAEEEWVAWTPSGYYAASENGEQLLGWQISHGPDQLASFLPASELREHFHRPAMIRCLLRTGSVEEGLRELGEKKVEIQHLLSANDSFTTPELP